MLIINQWIISILMKQVAGPESGISGRGKIEMIFHWVAEFATAILLLFSGISLILKLNWGVTLFLVAIGMLIYTLIDSPGYFAQQNKWSMVIMFVALLIAAIVSLVLVF